MRIWLLAVFAVLSLIHFTSFAKNIDLEHVLDYESLMELPIEERAAYLQGVQELMIELENIELSKKINREPQAASVFTGKPYLNSSKKVRCDFHKGLSMQLIPHRIHKIKAQSPIVKKSWYDPIGNLLPSKINKSITELFASYVPDPSQVHDLSPENPKDFVCVAPLLTEYSCPDGFVSGFVRWDKTVREKVTKLNEKCEHIDVQEDYKMGRRFACITKESFNSLPKSTKDYIKRIEIEELKIVAEQKALEKKCETLLTGGKEKRKKKFSERPISISSSEKLEKSCNSKSIADAREKFYRGPDSLCIYGGNISYYKGGFKKAGGCQPPSQFCFESPNCENSSTGDRFKPAFKCGTNEVICNPLIFGIKEDGRTPYCIGRSSNATLTCAEQSENSQDGLKSLLLSDKKRDGSSWIQSTGFGNAWNQFADQFNNLCSLDKNGAAYFCRECAVIRNRIQSLNAATIDGRALNFKDSKKSSGVK